MVLAAGLGTRLRPLTYEITKPMVPVLDRPVMEHIVDLLDKHGFEQVIANLHYFPDTIREHFGERLAVPLRAGAARHRRRRAGVRGLLRRRAVPRDLRRRAHGHRPEGARGAPPRERRDRDAGRQAGAGHARVRRRAARPRRAHHRLSGEAQPRGGALGPRQLRDLRVRPADLRLLPRRARSWTGRKDVFPVLLENDVPFHIHEVREYWNDVGSLGELRKGTFDALRGELHLRDRGRGAQPGRDRRRRRARRCARTPRSKARRGSGATCGSARACA